MNSIHTNLTNIPLPPGVGQAGPANQAGANQAGQAQGGASFKDYMLESIGHVNTMQQEANAAMESLATGGDATPGEVLTAVQKADLAFRMMLQVRNKLVEAYQQVEAIRV